MKIKYLCFLACFHGYSVLVSEVDRFCTENSRKLSEIRYNLWLPLSMPNFEETFKGMIGKEMVEDFCQKNFGESFENAMLDWKKVSDSILQVFGKSPQLKDSQIGSDVACVPGIEFEEFSNVIRFIIDSFFEDKIFGFTGLNDLSIDLMANFYQDFEKIREADTIENLEKRNEFLKKIPMISRLIFERMKGKNIFLQLLRSFDDNRVKVLKCRIKVGGIFSKLEDFRNSVLQASAGKEVDLPQFNAKFQNIKNIVRIFETVYKNGDRMNKFYESFFRKFPSVLYELRHLICSLREVPNELLMNLSYHSKTRSLEKIRGFRKSFLELEQQKLDSEQSKLNTSSEGSKSCDLLQNSFELALSAQRSGQKLEEKTEEKCQEKVVESPKKLPAVPSFSQLNPEDLVKGKLDEECLEISNFSFSPSNLDSASSILRPEVLQEVIAESGLTESAIEVLNQVPSCIVEKWSIARDLLKNMVPKNFDYESKFCMPKLNDSQLYEIVEKTDGNFVTPKKIRKNSANSSIVVSGYRSESFEKLCSDILNFAGKFSVDYGIFSDFQKDLFVFKKRFAKFSVAVRNSSYINEVLTKCHVLYDFWLKNALEEDFVMFLKENGKFEEFQKVFPEISAKYNKNYAQNAENSVQFEFNEFFSKEDRTKFFSVFLEGNAWNNFLKNEEKLEQIELVFGDFASSNEEFHQIFQGYIRYLESKAIKIFGNKCALEREREKMKLRTLETEEDKLNASKRSGSYSNLKLLEFLACSPLHMKTALKKI